MSKLIGFSSASPFIPLSRWEVTEVVVPLKTGYNNVTHTNRNYKFSPLFLF